MKPIYLVSPSGGTIRTTGPSAQKVADQWVKFGYHACTQTEWQAARRRQQREERMGMRR